MAHFSPSSVRPLDTDNLSDSSLNLVEPSFASLIAARSQREALRAHVGSGACFPSAPTVSSAGTASKPTAERLTRQQTGKLY